MKTHPCVGCGWCCIKVPCPLSLAKWGLLDCPALAWDEERGRYVCQQAAEWRYELYISEGCCANLNSWRWDVKNRDDARGRNCKTGT